MWVIQMAHALERLPSEIEAEDMETVAALSAFKSGVRAGAVEKAKSS